MTAVGLAAMVADLLSARLGREWTVRALGASAFCETWRAAGRGDTLFVKSAPFARAAASASTCRR